MVKVSDKLKIGNKFFDSRLMLGTGKYRTANDAIESIIIWIENDLINEMNKEIEKLQNKL